MNRRYGFISSFLCSVPRIHTEHGCRRDHSDTITGGSLESRFCRQPVVDAVYTWVNGSDPHFQTRMIYYRARHLVQRIPDHPSAAPLDALLSDGRMSREQSAGVIQRSRYREFDQLKYSLRSLFRFAPWIRRIWLITNGQIPTWLDLEHPRLRVVTHTELFPDPDHLPVFSSPAIEAHLHRIPGLAEHFLYFNDDVSLGNRIWPEDFFSPRTGYRIYLSWEAPPCARDCRDTVNQRSSHGFVVWRNSCLPSVSSVPSHRRRWCFGIGDWFIPHFSFFFLFFFPFFFCEDSGSGMATANRSAMLRPVTSISETVNIGMISWTGTAAMGIPGGLG